MKLFMVLLGCKPQGRFTEQHDIFFGIGESLTTLLPQMYKFWPQAGREIHIDAWREVTNVDGYNISIMPKESSSKAQQLYFLNLGGYKENEIEEYHYKMLSVAPELSQAVKNAKASAFYKHYGFKGAVSHIDDKYGVDVDDVFNVVDILGDSQYGLEITPNAGQVAEDRLNIGYLKLSKLKP